MVIDSFLALGMTNICLLEIKAHFSTSTCSRSEESLWERRHAVVTSWPGATEGVSRDTLSSGENVLRLATEVYLDSNKYLEMDTVGGYTQESITLLGEHCRIESDMPYVLYREHMQGLCNLIIGNSTLQTPTTSRRTQKFRDDELPHSTASTLQHSQLSGEEFFSPYLSLGALEWSDALNCRGHGGNSTTAQPRKRIRGFLEISRSGWYVALSSTHISKPYNLSLHAQIISCDRRRLLRVLMLPPFLRRSRPRSRQRRHRSFRFRRRCRRR